MTAKADIIGRAPHMNFNRQDPEPENLLPAVRDMPLIPAKPIARYTAPPNAMQMRMLIEMAKRPDDAKAVEFNQAPTPVDGQKSILASIMMALTKENLSTVELAERTGRRYRSVQNAVGYLRGEGHIAPVDDAQRPKYKLVDGGSYLDPEFEDNRYKDRREHILSVMTGEHSCDELCELAGMTRTICYQSLKRMVDLDMLSVRKERAGGRNLYSKP